MSYVSVNSQKRVLIMMIACISVAALLLVRLLYIQIIKTDYYSQKAYAQQTRSKSVEPKRGTIYDTTGERVLAQSISTNIVTAVPNSVSKDNKENIATNIAQILEKDKDEILKKLQQNVSSVTLATKVDQEISQKLLEYLDENDITGICLRKITRNINT